MAVVMVVIKWIAYSPSTPTIQVRIPLKTANCWKRTKINKKEAGGGTFNKYY